MRVTFHGRRCAFLLVVPGRCIADIPKAMLGAAVVRDQARPEWPESSSLGGAVALTAAAAAAAGEADAQYVYPALAYRQLTEACWAHDPADRYVPVVMWISKVLRSHD